MCADVTVNADPGRGGHFKRVKAPEKELVLIPDAGHFAFMTAPQAFLAPLEQKVRPVAIAQGG